MVEEYEQINKDIAIRAEYVASVARKAFDDYNYYQPMDFDSGIEYSDNFVGLIKTTDGNVLLEWNYPVPYESYEEDSRLRLTADLFDSGTWDQLYRYFYEYAEENMRLETKKELRNTLMEISNMKSLYGDIDYVTLVCDALNGEDVDKLVEEYT